MRCYLKLIFIGLAVLCPVIASYAQDAGNFTATALDLSRTNTGGSARILGIGGASTALGGDISAISSNPAGLGFFNRSEFGFSMQFNNVSTSSNFIGNNIDDSRLNFNLPNLGFVRQRSWGDSKWQSGSLGISVNRVADFQNQITYQGANTLDDFISYAVFEDNNFGPNDLTDLVFNTFLTDEFFQIYNGEESINIDGFDFNINDLFGDNIQIGDSLFFVDRNIFNLSDDEPSIPQESLPSIQEETVVSRGGIYQTTLAYGANYDDKFYIGANIGVLSVNREIERTYVERPTNSTLDNLVLEDRYEINGIGVVGTIGMIFRPISPVLIGASYTTPSYYSLEQVREITLTANYTDFTRIDGVLFTPFDYNITTPSRLKGGATFFFNKNGFITGEVERVKYAGARLSQPSDGVSFTEFNNDIDRLDVAYNYRVGAEYRYDMFRFRAGYAYIADPTDDMLDQSISEISVGGGIRKEKFYLDLGVVSSNGPETLITPYPEAISALAENNNTRVTLSFGVFF